MQTRTVIAGLAVAAALTSVPSAHAINHTSDYRTNMQNFRTCADPALGTCDFPDVVSPSKYNLTNGSTVTVVYQNGGTVQLRIDANGIAADNDVSYPCDNTLFQCVTGHCTGLAAPTACNPDRCFGGPNHGAPCSALSQCPGGSCTGGSACVRLSCQDGPRAGKACGAGQISCASTAETSGWSLVFRGNRSGFTLSGSPPNWHYQLQGDDDGDGCMVVCPFSLNASGAINTSSLTCSTSGACYTGTPESFHYVELRDPEGEVLAIPGSGAVSMRTWVVEGDPAVTGDCIRVPSLTPCQ